jgi:predicted enzyme related to lactoylglutathione lyase
MSRPDSLSVMWAGEEEAGMNEHEKLNYVEFPAGDLAATKSFFETCFGWSFVDYGPDYAAFMDQGLHGGFFKSEKAGTVATGSALLVFYSDELENTLAKVEAAGGSILKPIFTFPGGRRFHFIEPSGNEFAVWGEAGD